MDRFAHVYKGTPPDHCVCDQALRQLPNGEWAIIDTTSYIRLFQLVHIVIGLVVLSLGSYLYLVGAYCIRPGLAQQAPTVEKVI